MARGGGGGGGCGGGAPGYGPDHFRQEVNIKKTKTLTVFAKNTKWNSQKA